MTVWRAFTAAVIVCAITAPGFAADKSPPSCQLHKSRAVSFRSATSPDILDISIGPGACYDATLKLVVLTNAGVELYSYIAPFKRHTATDWEDPNLDRDAQQFVDSQLSGAMSLSSDLPPFAEPDAYYEANYQTIKVPRAMYEKLRDEPRPMLCHATYYEGWQCVVFDEKTGKAVIVTAGGV
jgi:hypothetical protein